VTKLRYVALADLKNQSTSEPDWLEGATDEAIATCGGNVRSESLDYRGMNF
jgi:hypothetical protein